MERTLMAVPRPSPQLTEPDPIVSALSNPLRIEILRRSVEPISAKQLADVLGESIGNVSYHSRVLLDAGLLETVQVSQVRGALQKFNRRTRRAKRDIRKVADDLAQLADAL